MKAYIVPLTVVLAGSLFWFSCQSRPAKPEVAPPAEATSAASDAPSQNPAVAIAVLASGSQSTAQNPSVEIIRDADGLTAAWATFSKSQAPQVDFGKQLVVAVFMGTRKSGGYQYELGNSEFKDGTWHIEVIESKPGLNEMVTMALTNPYIVFAVPLTGRDPLVTLQQVQRK